MKITKPNLELFRDWLLTRGRSEGTADTYLANLRACARSPRLTSRLIDDELAPLSRRTNKAALCAWARYTKDNDLLEIVKEIKLPPARRVGVKVPLATLDWQRLAGAIERVPDAKIRHTTMIIAKRGLRVSDALRIKRTEVVAALRTGVLSYVGKGGKRHEVSADELRDELEALAALRDWIDLRALVSGGKARVTAANRIRRAIRRVAGELKIDGMGTHRFRRTYATHFLAEHKGDPQALIKLQQHMGWASLATAAMYSDAIDKEDLTAAGKRMHERIFKK